jgi:hypothetical protein
MTARQTRAASTGGHTLLPIILILSRRVNIGSRPSQVTSPKRSSQRAQRAVKGLPAARPPRCVSVAELVADTSYDLAEGR